jgi:hypothetical protein
MTLGRILKKKARKNGAAVNVHEGIEESNLYPAKRKTPRRLAGSFPELRCSGSA